MPGEEILIFGSKWHSGCHISKHITEMKNSILLTEDPKFMRKVHAYIHLDMLKFAIAECWQKQKHLGKFKLASYHVSCNTPRAFAISNKATRLKEH